MPEPLEPFDPGNFRLCEKPTNSTRKVQAPFRRRLSLDAPFLAGPVDMEWLSQARKLGVTALWVGIVLWHLRGLRKSNSIIVSNMTMRKWGIEPDAKTRALRKLEKAQLIAVERRGRRSPMVTILPVQMKSTPIMGR